MGCLILTVLLILIVFPGLYRAEELNLNFRQNDYQLTFQRIEVLRYNKFYVDNIKLMAVKYNRSFAVTNASLTIKTGVGNDMKVLIQVYKFMSNEYRHFPLRFEANTCKALEADSGGVMSGLLRCGNFRGCPIQKGSYHVCNWYPESSKLPPKIPNGRYKVEIVLTYFADEVAVMDAFVVITRPIT